MGIRTNAKGKQWSKKATINFHSRIFRGFKRPKMANLWRMLRIQSVQVLGLLQILRFWKNEEDIAITVITKPVLDCTAGRGPPPRFVYLPINNADNLDNK